MLECKKYSKAEISKILGSNSRQSISRKLERYGVKYQVEGRGENLSFTITDIQDPFKVFCILELEYSPQTDFTKLCNFFWYYFNDEEFMAMPDEVKENRMRQSGFPVSRQTIRGYVSKLEQKDYIYLDSGNYIYYFAYKSEQIMTDEATYKEAWHEYWRDEEGRDSGERISYMRAKYGGIARKQAIPIQNAIYSAELEYLQRLVVSKLDKGAVEE